MIKTYKVDDRIDYHIIDSDKFKSDLISVYFTTNLSKKSASYMALISRLLTRGTEKYRNMSEISDRLDELFGSILSADLSKYGEKIVMQLKLRSAMGKYVGDDNLLKDGMDLLSEVIFSPLMDGDGFNKLYFDQEKIKLIEEIESRVNDKVSYAMDRCVELMCDDEPFSVYRYGDVDTVNGIANNELFDYYQDVLDTAKIDIIYYGVSEVSDTIDSAAAKFSLRTRQGYSLSHPEKCAEKELRELTEYMNLNQAKLSMGFRTNITFRDELYYPLAVFSEILGGGGNSVLFRNVREKESLCYYIFSRVEKHKGIMLVSSGVNPENVSRVKEMILSEIDEIVKGNFTDKDIELAKKNIVNSLRSIQDYQNAFCDYYFSRNIVGLEYDEESIIEAIEGVKRDDIISAAKMLGLQSVYVLMGEENE